MPKKERDQVTLDKEAGIPAKVEQLRLQLAVERGTTKLTNTEVIAAALDEAIARREEMPRAKSKR